MGAPVVEEHRPRESTLGYRSFLRVHGQHDLLGLVDGQLYSWLKEKQWNPDALLENEVVALNENVEATRIIQTQKDGSSTVRCRFEEHNDSGRWLTQVTCHQESSGAGWVWVDVRNPEGFKPGVPRLVRGLVEVLNAADGSCPATSAAHIIDSTEVHQLVDWLEDTDRRGYVFVAGSNNALPLPRWKDYVDGLIHQTVGIASAFVLDPAATELFNSRVGSAYAVPPGTLRTFVPGLDTEDVTASVRHRILSTSRIISDKQRTLRGLLGSRAMEASLAAPIPRKAQRIDVALRSQLDDLLLSGPPPSETDNVGADLAASAAAVIERPISDSRAEEGSSLLSAVTSAVRAVWGDARKATVETIRELGGLAAEQLRSTQAAAKRIGLLEAAVSDSAEAISQLRTRLEDEMLQTEEVSAEERTARLEVHRLRMVLQEAGLAEAAWDQPTDATDAAYPSDFEELLQRVESLEHVIFTGDDSPVLDLYQQDPLGTWSKKAWDALVALDDYAGHKTNRGFDGGVFAYLSSTPTGCRGFSVNRFAADESDSVKTMPKFRKHRMLPVPESVDESGRAFMGAHFKIARSGQISPRLHFFDDVDDSGKVYVGYIGKHLPNTMTS